MAREATAASRTRLRDVCLGVNRDIERLVEYAADFSGRRLGPLRRLSFLLMPPIQCALLYRLSHWLHSHGRRGLACQLARVNYVLHKSAISPAARIGPGLYVPHTVGVVFQAHAGDNLTLYAWSKVVPPVIRHWDGEVPGDAPRLGSGVTVGVGTVVVGPITVPDGTHLRACSVLMAPAATNTAGASLHTAEDA